MGRFFFQPGQGRVEGPFSIPPFGFAETLNVYFCPDIDNDLTYFGQLMIQSNDPESPHTISLSGTELAVAEIATAPYGDGDTWSFHDTTLGYCSATYAISIMNIGLSPLTLASVASSNIDFNIVDPLLPNTVLDSGQSIDLEFEFCPVGSFPGPRSGILTIHHDAINEPDPITISLNGNAT